MTSSRDMAPNVANKFTLWQRLANIGPTLFVLAIMAVGWFAVHEINTMGAADEEVVSPEDTSLPNTLILPAGKLAAANFKSEPIQLRPLAPVHTIPGRIRYDETQHVNVQAPLDAILSEILVSTGQRIKTGDLIAVLRSPEIGKARAEILKRTKDQEIAKQVLAREQSLLKNLNEMITLLDQASPVTEIETKFQDRALGAYRDDILSAYTNLKLSTQLLNRIIPLGDSGAVAGRTVLERQAERQIAENQFRTARDQAIFAAQQATLNAEAILSDADRQLELAWQSVESLLGSKQSHNLADLTSEDALSRLEVRAPMSGSVESRGFTNNERVQRGDSLIVLANTDSLYVAANIREGDWAAVSLEEGTTVSVIIPALDDRAFEARVRYFGREVQTETNSIPLVATIENSEHLLRPGMFVRVTIPVGAATETLAVKPASIVQHENQSFVFVENKPGEFQRVDVETGESSEDWVEVKRGLSAGQRVVTDGAFLLKSELLLQGEGE